MSSAGDIVWPVAVSLTEALSGFSRVVYVPNRQMPCPVCIAQPENAQEQCDDCGGSGLQITLKRIMVDIPPLRDDLSRLRVRGAGNYMEAERAFGDIILVCHIRPEPNISVADGLLRFDVNLSATQAELGGTIEVTILNHLLAIDLPPNVKDGQHLKLPPDLATYIPLPLVLQAHVIADETDGPPSGTAEVAELSKLAAAAEAEGRFDVARDRYAEIVRHSAHPKTLIKLSAMQLRLGETNSAVATMQRAQALAPDDAEISYYLAMCHARNSNYLMAAVELERARRIRFPAARAEEAHRRIIKSVFMPTEDLTLPQLDRACEGLKLAVDRYYGAASQAYQAVLEEGERPHAYYWLGAADWLLTVESAEDRLASAYLSLTQAARCASDIPQLALGATLIRDELLTRGTTASRVRVCTHFIREGQIQEAQAFLLQSLRDARRFVPSKQREISTDIEASQSFARICEHYTSAHSRVHASWHSAFSQAAEARRRLDQVTADGRDVTELTRGELGNLVRICIEVVRDLLSPAIGTLEGEIEEASRLAPQYHALLEQTIEWSGRLAPLAQNLARCCNSLQRGSGSAQKASADAFAKTKREVAAIYAAMEARNTAIGHELSCLWRSLALSLQLSVRLQSLLKDEEPLRDARTLARALELLQASINMDPNSAASDTSAQVLCDLLDEYQLCAQAAAGSGALTRVELLQNTIDAINSQVSPFQIASSPTELMAEDKLRLFDWAVETLFEAAVPLPREFIIAARTDCYAVSNYRLAHRVPDTTTYQILPLSQMERYDVHVSGVTMRNVLVTLRDGRRVTFSGVRTADVLPHEQVSWLLGAHMWQNLAAAELEALTTGRAAPPPVLYAQGSHVQQGLPAVQAIGQLPSATSTKMCGQCGQQNFVRDRFCRGCGRQLDTEQAALPPDASMPKLLSGQDKEG